MRLFKKNKIFIIAELANSHEGKLSLAKKITENAAKAGADAVKFQKFTADELAEPTHEYYSLYKQLEMTNKEWNKLINFAKKKNLKVFVDIFGVQSLKSLSKFNIDGYKIHSADLSNPTLLQFLAKTQKTVLLSAAGSLPNEIDEAITILSKTPKEIAIMHGFQGYPTKLSDSNLLRIKTLKAKYDLPIGLMDHISGNSPMSISIPLIGIGLGATIIEKHLTLDRSKKGLDYYSALNPDEFKKLVTLIRKTTISLGIPDLSLSTNETKYRLNHKKNPISKTRIRKGTVLDEKMFVFKRTKAKQSVSYYDFKGKVSSKDISKGSILTKNMLSTNKPKVVAVIACRVDSARMFAKPMQLVGKYTILEHLLNQIKTSYMIDEIVLAISENPGNEIFIDFAKKQKIKFIRGDDEDVLKRLIDGAKYVNADIIFRITSENPYIFWNGIDHLIKNHISGKHDLSFYEKIPLGAYFEVINLKALETSHRKGKRKHRSELCTLYINEHKNQFKINHLAPEKSLQRPEIRLTVDSPQDLWVARIIHEQLGKGIKPISLKQIVKFLDDHPEITQINSKTPIGKSRIWT